MYPYILLLIALIGLFNGLYRFFKKGDKSFLNGFFTALFVVFLIKIASQIASKAVWIVLFASCLIGIAHAGETSQELREKAQEKLEQNFEKAALGGWLLEWELWA